MTSVVIIRKGHPKFDAPKIIVLICPKGQTRLLHLSLFFDPYFNGNVLKVQRHLAATGMIWQPNLINCVKV